MASMVLITNIKQIIKNRFENFVASLKTIKIYFSMYKNIKRISIYTHCTKKKTQFKNKIKNCKIKMKNARKKFLNKYKIILTKFFVKLKIKFGKISYIHQIRNS